MHPQPTYQIPGRTPVEPFPAASYWSEQFSREPYFLEGDSYDDYDAAYRVGHGARQHHPARDFASLEPVLQREWESRKGLSRLEWDRARQAVLRAWERAATPEG